MGSDTLALRQHVRNLEAANSLLRRDLDQIRGGRPAHMAAPASILTVPQMGFTPSVLFQHLTTWLTILRFNSFLSLLREKA